MNEQLAVVVDGPFNPLTARSAYVDGVSCDQTPMVVWVPATPVTGS